MANNNFKTPNGIEAESLILGATLPATAGIIRLANNQSINFRNAANNANLGLTLTVGNFLQSNADFSIARGTEVIKISNGALALTNSLYIGEKPAAASGDSNTAVGVLSGNSITAGAYNSFLGDSTGKMVDTGNFNTLMGASAGIALTSGAENIALGGLALASCVTGIGNTALGHGASLTTTGGFNVAIGFLAGYLNTQSDNTFVGASAGSASTSGVGLTLMGKNAGVGLTTGSYHTMVGVNAGSGSTIGTGNCFFGINAGATVTTGSNNFALGTYSGTGITTGNGNIFIGASAGDESALYTGSESSNLSIGARAASISDAYLGQGIYSDGTLTPFTIQPTSASGTNKSASLGVFGIAGARGTGTGIGGDIVFKTSSAGGSGSSLNSLVVRSTISTTSITNTIPILNPTASKTAPAYSFSVDPDTGLYSFASDEIGFATGAEAAGKITGNGTISQLTLFSDGGTTNTASLRASNFGRYILDCTGSTGTLSAAGAAIATVYSDVNGVKQFGIQAGFTRGSANSGTPQTLTAATTELVTKDTSFIKLTSDDTTAANRLFTLSIADVLDGQRLTIYWNTSYTGGGGVASSAGKLVSSGTTHLSADWVPQENYTIELMLVTNPGSVQTRWLEISRSNNT